MKLPPPAVLLALADAALVGLGFAAVVAGIWVLLGVGYALVVCGLLMLAGGLAPFGKRSRPPR